LEDMCIRLDTRPECDGQTDGRTDVLKTIIALCMHSMLKRDKSRLDKHWSSQDIIYN